MNLLSKPNNAWRQKNPPQKQKNNARRPIKARLSKAIRNPSCIVSVCITLFFAVITAIFFRPSIQRLGEGFYDIFTSFAHVFADREATVNKLPAVNLQDLNILPQNKDVFITRLKLFCLAFAHKNTYMYFMSELGAIAGKAALVILSLTGPALAVALITVVLFKNTDNRDNVDTIPLRLAKTVSKYTYRPIKRACAAFCGYLKTHKAFLLIWAAIWCINFNFFTIVLELIAYYYYLLAGFDISTFYIQLYKLFLDLSTVITFFPVWAWVIIFIAGFGVFRRIQAKQKLKRIEKTCEETVAALPVATLITGAMNTKKTTFMTELAITYNKYFRDVADGGMFKISMRFPNFPWINVERCVMAGFERHTVYNLATCRQFIRFVKSCYYSDGAHGELRKKLLKERYGYTFKNYIFDYDVKLYGLEYFDELEKRDIFSYAENYACFYFIYFVSCSLVYANYSVRLDDYKKDKGNFPLWDNDFFSADPGRAKAHTRRSHILDFDALRLGEKFVSGNKFKNSIDFGIIAVTEVGKERANQKTIKGEYFSYVNDNGVRVTPENDLLTMDEKMCRHRATVDNFPFVVYLMDEQRASSLNADTKELSDLLYIKNSSEFKFVTPLFAADELIYAATCKLMLKLHDNSRYHKSSNTLLMYAVENFYSRFIFKPYERNFNMFTASTLTFCVQDGKESDEGHKLKYKLCKKKIHSARFSTDAYGSFYFDKTLRSRVGINDVPEYKDKQASRSELEATHGFLSRGMGQMFYDDKK